MDNYEKGRYQKFILSLRKWKIFRSVIKSNKTLVQKKKKKYNWELWYGEVMTSILSLQNYFLPTPNIHLHLGMGPGSSYSNLVSPPCRINLFRNKQSQESVLVRERWRRVPKIKPEEESKGIQGETNYSKKHSSTWIQSHSSPLNSLFPFLLRL